MKQNQNIKPRIDRGDYCFTDLDRETLDEDLKDLFLDGMTDKEQQLECLILLKALVLLLIDHRPKRDQTLDTLMRLLYALLDEDGYSISGNGSPTSLIMEGLKVTHNAKTGETECPYECYNLYLASKVGAPGHMSKTVGILIRRLTAVRYGINI